jgi:signal transduction histidine kinase/sugar lactone lactonase YvrE
MVHLSNPESPGRELRRFGTEAGLSQNEVLALAEDLHGNLWIGTEAGGLMRLARGGLTSYAEAEGLENPRIASIFETAAGRLCVADSERVFCEREGRFTAIRPNVPGDALGWGWYQWVLEDRHGDWWIPTREGLHRFRGLERPEDLASARPSETFTVESGLPANGIFRLYEDSRGDVWIGTISPPRAVQLTVWRRDTGELHHFTTEDGLPQVAPTAFREDGRGGLWIGFYLGGVARYRNGRFRIFGPSEGCPAGFIRAIHRDGRGRIWVAGTAGGIARIDDPGAETPRFEAYTTELGLSSNFVAAITEDERGLLYLGTDRGIDRLDPETGAIRSFTVADGLPNGFVNTAHRDREGMLWFGTLRGLARLEPREDAPTPRASVFIDRIRVAGTPLPVSELGQHEVAEVRLSHGQDRVRIEFGGISFSPGSPLRYQYRLEGSHQEWSEPTGNRAVDFANLAPGSYRFLVRAVDAEGRSSPVPAAFSFTIRRPWWQQWWFLLLAMVSLGALALAVHRARVARAVGLERVRTRIATDLHDDIGASLSQIAILSEVVSRRSESGNAGSREYLARIAESSRELVDSMSDIVWAINPQRDRLGDLVHRMRRFAGDTTAGDDVALVFRAPEGRDDLRLGPDLRRELYLVFKESLNNAVRHSGCSRVEASLSLVGDGLLLVVRDDGKGFDPAAEHEGNGVQSMRRRARALGAELAIESDPGAGTTVRMLVPSRGPRRLRQRTRSPA